MSAARIRSFLVRRIPYESGIVTPWFHGHVYRDVIRRETVTAVVPLHWLLQAAHWLGHQWCSLMGRPSWIDRTIERRTRQQIERERCRLGPFGNRRDAG